MSTRPEPRYFKNPAALRRWFAQHAGTATELVVGFMKVDSGSPSVTWPEAVDEALCVGRIDGVRHRIDDARYQIRFTPRRPGSNWSAVNLRRFEALQAAGRVTPAGAAAHAARTEARSRTASYEQETPPELDAAEVAQFKRPAGAWAFYEALPPSHRRRLTWWVVSAKRPATRQKRLATVIEACAQGKRL